MSQGRWDPPNPGFMQEKVKKGNFSKKPLRKLKKNDLGSYESLKDLKH